MEKIISTSRSHRGFIWTLVAVAIFGIGLTFTNYRAHAESTEAAGGRVITLHDSGAERGFITKKTTLREAFAEQEIRLDANDRTEPGLDEPLVAGSYQVNVYRARAVVIKDGALRTKIITSYRTGKQIMEQAKLTFQPEDTLKLSLSTDPIADGAAEVLTVARSTPVALVFYGKTLSVHTQARTVSELLIEKDITPASNDTLKPSADSLIVAGMTIELWKNGEQVVTVEEDVPYDTQNIYDTDQDRTYRNVQTAGVLGKRTVTYRYVMKNGEQVEKQELSSVVTQQPIKEVVVIGAKNNYSGSLNEWLLALRTCETHSNYATNTGNGFYGAYQFMIPTWNSIAKITGRTDLVGVRPDLAAPADQDAMVIANTNATAGLRTQHPGCYVELGLSNKPPAQ